MIFRPIPTPPHRHGTPVGTAAPYSPPPALAARSRAAHGDAMRAVRGIAQLGARLPQVSRSTTAGRAQLVQRPTLHLWRDRVARRAAATVAALIALIGAAPAGAEPPDAVTIGFDAVTTTVEWHGGQALGTSP